jgi:hypothetical protein
MDTLTVEILRPLFQTLVLMGIVAAVAVRSVQCGAQRAVQSATGRRSRVVQRPRTRRDKGRKVEEQVQANDGESDSHSLEQMALMQKPKAPNAPIRRFL